ncbi:hypothetical protein PH210_17160 [Paenibacillus sp. BSR1-1]|uniref:hypothetical protein n=1 Tax=Paenibacillus sp. BSR1-1 TaxID=3020845 RepID=UPI0025AED47E|nr:hypothetical protein [Paenibacillus sp. BSR1-1]MDN3017927.1 hypothetical protein [Paenibacillus sp. BSR1-1]
MHFRHFIISGLMVGAALFLPHNAFAEKNELSGQQNAAAVHAAKAESKNLQADVNAKAIGKTVPGTSNKNQAAIKQQASNHSSQQAMSQKQAATSKSLPAQAKGNVQAVIKKTEKNVEAPGQQKKAMTNESNQGLGKDKQTSENVSVSSNLGVNNPGQIKKRLETQREDSHLSEPKKLEPNEPLVAKPVSERQVPDKKDKIPNADQATNPTQRSNSSGGSSNDRVSQGLNTISTLDKWFEWNKYYEIKFVQLYLSRSALLTNQWVNAPPAPPPQEAPLLKMVNRR